jgi:hypothetical protein
MQALRNSIDDVSSVEFDAKVSFWSNIVDEF